jgi:hypothetical protein
MSRSDAAKQKNRPLNTDEDTGARRGRLGNAVVTAPRSKATRDWIEPATKGSETINVIPTANFSR